MLSISRLIAFLLLFLCVSAKAQDAKLDSVATNLSNYGLNQSQSGLYVHFDKNVYTNNDQVWFTAYLLKTITDMKQYHTLYLSLVNNKDSSVVLQQKFLIDKGCSFGALTLPDSLPGGAYRFVANTNLKVNGQPDGVFIQPITIKSTTITALNQSISVFKPYDEQTRKGTVLLRILTSDNRFVEDAQIRYQIGKGKQIMQTGTAKSSVIGELMIDYPADQITADNNELFVSIKKGKDTSYTRFSLPVRNASPYTVKFYPEGGYLVNGLVSKVGFEVKDAAGAALKAKAVLYADNEILDTIATNAMGLGAFMLQPQLTKKYTVRLLTEKGEKGIHELPGILNKGLVLTSGSAVANNDFKIRVEANIAAKVHLLVHNFSDIFLQTPLTLTAGSPQNVRFQLDSVPAGLQAVTVLDSNYKPLAERIFFAHYDQINTVNVAAGQQEYFTRDSVKLKLNITDRDKKPLVGMVSISCVQANRMLLANETNIVDYFYLHNLKEFSANSFGLTYADIGYLDELLLIKGWRKYKWPEIQINPRDQDRQLSSLAYEGVITRKNKKLNMPMGLSTIAGTNLNFLNTDSLGHFSIPYSSLVVNEPRLSVWLTMSTSKFDQYELKINEPQSELKKYLRQQVYVLPNTKTGTINENNMSITSTAGIRLKDVIIKKVKDERTDFAKNAFANACGDYVCMYNILNCPNHFGNSGNKSPMKGEVYKIAGGTGSTVYQGCVGQEHKPNLVILRGINLPKEFYIADINNKNEPINFATVYWNYQVLINGETPLKFNTGDITGKFKIIVQGVTDKGVVYGEQEITVNR
ncbi:hypothetical protein [Pedobacter soli]|uniref:MG2 domain-containing protein n=1 Tax=Pedobacter soli TaxID=390242 RepID=A0A1G6Y773_9SPHI|nr:hypothetical protein [Pedobacter soli]SDD86132.1 hypothetical protein SAMN04488024_108180 [Pedobacter soli]